MNVFHCCVHKTASQWLASILFDPRVVDNSDLKALNYHQEIVVARKAYEAPPPNTILTPLHIGYNVFNSIPKADDYRVFAVIRDPRDIIVSWYFSVRYSHKVMGNIPKMREELSNLSFNDGLKYAIRYLNEYGTFKDLLSWVVAEKNDPKIKVFKFSDLTSKENDSSFKLLFEHCQIDVPDSIRSQLLSEYSFENLSKRKRGTEDISSHFRKGISGDWVNSFDEDVEQYFLDIVDVLPEDLGYSPKKITLLEKRCQDLEHQLKQIEEERRKSGNSEENGLNSFQEKIDSIQAELGSKEEWIKDVEASATSLQNQIFQKEKALQELNIQIATLQQKIKKKDDRLRKAISSKTRLKNRLFQKKKALDKQRQKCSSLIVSLLEERRKNKSSKYFIPLLSLKRYNPFKRQ